jgi:CRP/FNR family transcriptional regulator, cyclic AMP receptor protein
VRPAEVPDAPDDTGDFLRLAAGLADVTVMARAGAWDPWTAGPDAGRGFAMLVLDGLLLCELHVHGEPTAHLLVSGETLDPRRRPDRVLSSDRMTWRALEDVTLAVLGARFLAATQRFPTLTAGLCRQQAAQLDRAVRYAAITKLPRVEQRVIAFFCAVAEERGRVVADGVLVDLALTHVCLGQLIGAKRPTVSLALKTLADDRLLTRHGGRWLLSRQVTALDGVSAATRRRALAA